MGRTLAFPTPERSAADAGATQDRVTVGRFSSYKAAKRAVDSLRVARIPEARITVLGRAMKFSQPLNAERAVRLGAITGLLVGAATTLLLWTMGALAPGLSWFDAALAGSFFGAALGVVVGLVGWRLTRDSGALPESGSVHVGRFDVLVEPADEPRARELLHG